MRGSKVLALAALAGIALAVAFTRPSTGAEEPLRLSGKALGTTWQVVAYPGGNGPGEGALRSLVETAIDGVNTAMSAFDPQSDVSCFNQADTTDWVPVSPETAEVVQLALDVGRDSDGALDITVAPLVNLWSFGWQARPDSIPDDAAIQDALALVGHHTLEVRSDPPALRKINPRASIDLASVAKGYAVDQVAKGLEAASVQTYLVDIGGELRAAGRKPDGNGGQPWKVGIEKPVAVQRTVQRILHLADSGMATSGSYRNYFEQDGVRYSHLLDPRTGRPITHRLVSVSVLHASCAVADAWATALMVLGDAEGLALAQRRGVAALFITSTGHGFEEKATTAFKAAEQQGAIP